MKTKFCKHCNTEKQFEKGHWRWAAKKGCFGTMCLDCFREVGKLARRKYRATEKGLQNARAANRKCMAKILSTPEGVAKNRHSSLNWAQNNKDKVAAQTRRYRAAKKNRIPSWADRSAIDEFYLAAQVRSENNEALSVDHIIPLCGRLVSGLHVQNNLQLLTRAENTRKNNKFDPVTSGFSFKELKTLFTEFDRQVQSGS